MQQNTLVNNLTYSALQTAPLFIKDRAINHEIHTNRLYLRPVQSSDLNNFIELFSDPSVMRFIGIEAGEVPSRQEIEQLLIGAVKAWKTRGYGRWTMFDSKTGEFVGFCGFRSEQGIPELIAALHERFWGQGLAAEAAVACLEYGCKSLGFTTIRAFTRPEHSRARKVLSKLDAEFDGFTDFHGVTGAAYSLIQKSTYH